ncbi:9182_t:CDS:10 [Entrophospora sp. SA101]|nr:9182_t:CDS:10 [Entrophospora sp. SA101]
MDNTEERKKHLPEIRERSRQTYLKDRATKQMHLLELDVIDEDLLFKDEKLTKKEKKELEFKRETLRLTRERLNLSIKTDEYHMPEGKIDKKKKDTVLYQRYEEDRDQKGFVNEQEVWEKNQIVKSQLNVGAQDRLKGEDYEFVFEEPLIDFLDWDWKANDKDEALLARIEEAEKKLKNIEEVRKSLPIYTYRDDLLKAIEDHQVLVVIGETGSGKTTQLPQYLYEAGYTKDDKKIGCTQPRRVAAMSVAARVAEEMNVKLGFEDISRVRTDLRLIISSATLNAQKFAAYFDDAPIFRIPGKPYPVQICHTKAPEANYISAAIATVMQIHISQNTGDILVFLTGQEEIETVQESLQQTCRVLGSKVKELIICPIYSNLPPDMQAKIFEATPPGARKSIGVDVMKFEFMDPPHEQGMISALNDLYALGALNNDGELTKLGRRMAEFPIDPLLSKTIITSEKFHCSEEDKKFYADKAHQNFIKPGGDHLMLLNIWEQWAETNYSMGWCYENFIVYRSMNRARDVRDQLVKLCDRTEVELKSNPDPGDIIPIQKSIVSGFFMNAARLTMFSDSYHKLKFGDPSRVVHIHPSSSLFEEKPKFVLYFELVLTSKEYMRQVMEIKPEWLVEAAPHYYSKEDIGEKKKMPKNNK